MSSETQQRLLELLKTHAPLTAQQLASILDLTSMGARKQLETAMEKGLVEFTDHAEGIGRPQRWWRLSATGHARFPERNSEILSQLIDHVRDQFGADALEAFVSTRETKMTAQYTSALQPCASTAEKLEALAACRSNEGYMAEIRTIQNGWELIEHHCPICDAAGKCQSFCRSELNMFQSLLPDTTIERTEHLLSDGMRCIYRITPL